MFSSFFRIFRKNSCDSLEMALCRECSISTSHLVQRGGPLILTVDHRWRRRDKSSSSYLNCIDWLPVSSHPPLHPPHRSPVSQAGQSNSAGKPETLPTPALWLDRCEKKEAVVVETCHVGMTTPPTPPPCFANQSAGCENRSVGSIWQVGRWRI